MRVAAVLLAAGLSTRFGADKIAALVDGVPLGHHAGRTLDRLDLETRIVITRAGGLAWPGFTAIPNPSPGDGLSSSIRLGVAAARAAKAEAVLMVLADMPFVPISHFRQILSLWQGADTILASTDGVRRMPPALFGSGWFDALALLDGDRGARPLLDQAMLVEASPNDLRDIDRPSDLGDARRAPV